jgi:putative flippase GtrA
MVNNHNPTRKQSRHRHFKQQFQNVRSKAYESKGMRYIFSGGIATMVDVALFFILYNYVFHREILKVKHIEIGPHIASLIISFCAGLITNFLITKYFVFKESNIRGREQFVRYVAVAFITFWGNYFMMKLMVDVFAVWPTVARVIAVGLIAVLSFRLHKIFTFKVKLEDAN